MKRLLFIVALLSACQTTQKPQTGPEACESLCRTHMAAPSLAYEGGSCICKTDDGIKTKLGMCGVATNDADQCLFEAAKTCEMPDTVRRADGFCDILEKVLSGLIGYRRS